MPRKKELPAPESGEQDDLLSAETQELPDTLLPEPQEEPIPTESPPEDGAPEDDAPSEEYEEFLQALNEAPAQEEPQPVSSDEAEPLPSEEEPALTIPAEEPSSEPAPPESPPTPRNDAVLTIAARTRIKSEAEATDELWHEIRNAYRTRRILTGTLDGMRKMQPASTTTPIRRGMDVIGKKFAGTAARSLTGARPTARIPMVTGNITRPASIAGMALATIAAVVENINTVATAQARNTMSIMKRNIQSKNIAASVIPTLVLPRNRIIP